MPYMYGDRPPCAHELKVNPEYYLDLSTQRKNFEVRRKDRDYQVGDFIILKEYNCNSNNYTGHWILSRISYILDDPRFCKEGYVILGLKFIEP